MTTLQENPCTSSRETVQGYIPDPLQLRETYIGEMTRRLEAKMKVRGLLQRNAG